VREGGFRRFLRLAKAAEPAELEPAGVYPGAPFAPLTTRADAGPVRVVSVDEKAEPSLESVGQVSAEKSKKAEPPRSRSGYMWVSERSRSKRAAWADMPERF